MNTIFPTTWYDFKIKECTQDKEMDNHANCFSSHPDYKDYPDASPEPTPEPSEESSPEDSGVEPSETSSRREIHHLHSQYLQLNQNLELAEVISWYVGMFWYV